MRTRHRPKKMQLAFRYHESSPTRIKHDERRNEERAP
jgi:hypothetical protein